MPKIRDQLSRTAERRGSSGSPGHALGGSALDRLMDTAGRGDAKAVDHPGTRLKCGAQAGARALHLGRLAGAVRGTGWGLDG